MTDRAIVFIDGNNWFHGLGHVGVEDREVGPREWIANRYDIGQIDQQSNPAFYANLRCYAASAARWQRRANPAADHGAREAVLCRTGRLGFVSANMPAVTGLIADDVALLTDRVRNAESFHDLAGLNLVFLQRIMRFCDENKQSPDYHALLRGYVTVAMKFQQAMFSVFTEIANRPGNASGFSRRFGILPSPFARTLPKDIRRALSRIREPQIMAEVARATGTVCYVLTNIAILRAFPFPRDNRWQFLTNIIETLLVGVPGTLRYLPADIVAWLAEEPPRFGLCCELRPPVAQYLDEATDAIFINTAVPTGNSTCLRAHAIGKALATNDHRFIDKAIDDVRRVRWYLTSTDKRAIPTNWDEYNHDFNVRSLIRIAAQSTIIYDCDDAAIFDTGTARVVAYLPSLPGEACYPTRTDQIEYNQAPLAFLIKHRGDHAKGSAAAATHVVEDNLKALRNEVFMEQAAGHIREAIHQLAGNLLSVAPEAALTAATYFIVARQLGFSDADTLATLEGIVHAVLRSVSRALRGQKT